MEKLQKKILFMFFAALLYAPLVQSAHAATLYMVSGEDAVSVGKEFFVDLRLDSGAVSINAAEATIRYPASVLELLSVDKSDSVFGLWLEEPAVSQASGTMHFIGGSSKGVSGPALEVLRMRFKAKQIGSAGITIADGVVTASDGKGTNVLTAFPGVTVAVGSQVLPAVPPTPIVPPISPVEVPVERPVPIVRVPAAVKNLPQKPVLRVPLYPDQSRWYNRIGEVIVLWDLPPDVAQVSTLLSRNATAQTGIKETELFSGKSFGIIGEGVWYIRVQFKNNVGWGEAAYYKISLDTTVPVAFNVKIDSALSDNPMPTIQFETSDSLSGIAFYRIATDGKDVATTTSTTMQLPLQPPGKHLLVVSALDLAGNSVEDSIDFEILPLPTPEIEFITRSVTQGEFVFASGKGAPNAFVEARIMAEGGREIFRGEVETDTNGRWDITVKEALAIGRYVFLVTAHDNRGAQSLASEPEPFRIKAQSIVSFGFVELGWFEILITVILLATTGASLVSRKYILKKQMRGMYNIIATRDVIKLGDILLANIKELSQIPSANTGTDAQKITYLIGTMKENVEKIKKYIGAELEKLK